MYKILRDRRFCAVPNSDYFLFFSVTLECGLLPVVFILPLNGMKFKKLRPFIYFQFKQKPKLRTDSAFQMRISVWKLHTLLKDNFDISHLAQSTVNFISMDTFNHICVQTWWLFAFWRSSFWIRRTSVKLNWNGTNATKRFYVLRISNFV